MKQKDTNAAIEKRSAPVVIDGANLVLGRMSSVIAKRLLQGESISLVNAERVVVTGTKDSAMAKFKARRELTRKGFPESGPQYSRTPDRMVWRCIRGMLPLKTKREKYALQNFRVYVGVPAELKNSRHERIPQAENTLEKGFTTMLEISTRLGYTQKKTVFIGGGERA
ncbi:MAG: 50S ribosomal protein L13 [Candidatus Diapherotrites archaeon]|nr:50S ribosomal protein L13 [Candidatus Diapherotrites archaeon]